LKIRERLNQILSAHTGQPVEKVATDTDRDFFMGGDEAVAYGLVDRLLSRRGEALPLQG
jgi:ATP-dependent Clp protease protease subunit